MAGKSHVVVFEQPGSAEGGWRGPTSQRGSRRAEREGLRRGKRASSAVGGPIGWEGVDSHECNAPGDSPNSSLEEGRSISQLECWETVRIGPAERFGARRSVWLIERTRHHRRSSRFTRSLRLPVEKGSGEPTSRCRNDPIGANIFYLWRGEPQ